MICPLPVVSGRSSPGQRPVVGPSGSREISPSMSRLHSSSGISTNIDNLPELKLNPAKAFIAEPFWTSLEIPETLQLKDPKIMILSPVLGPIDLQGTGLVEMQYSARLEAKAGAAKSLYSPRISFRDQVADAKFIARSGTIKSITGIDIRSLKPITANLDIQGQNIPTTGKFPIIITEAGKAVARSSIEFGLRELEPQEQSFMRQLDESFKQGKSFIASYPVGSSTPTIKLAYNKATKMGQLKAGLKELWNKITGKKVNPFGALLQDDGKTPEQRRQETNESTDYLNIEILDVQGQMKTRFNAWNHYLGKPGRWGAGMVVRSGEDKADSGSIGGGSGPIFNSAQEFATFALNNFAFPSQEGFAPQFFEAKKPNPSSLS